jgi:hypothetical protein
VTAGLLEQTLQRCRFPGVAVLGIRSQSHVFGERTAHHRDTTLAQLASRAELSDRDRTGSGGARIRNHLYAAELSGLSPDVENPEGDDLGRLTTYTSTTTLTT